MDSQKFCLKWNNYQNSVTSVFENLRQDEELVDITLCCEGHKIKAHRMMLSACSPYFRDLLKENPCQHPVFFLKDTSYPDLAAVVEFVYKGEVNVAQSQLGSFLKTAEMLQVRGLTGDDDEEVAPQTQQQSSKPSTPRGPGRPPVSSAPAPHLNSGLSGRPRPASPPLKRQRLSISPDRTGAAPASSAPAAPAPAPAASLPAALPPPPPPMPPLSLPMSSTVPAPLPPATSSMVTAHSDLTSRAATAAAPDRAGAGAEPPMSPATEEPRTPQQQTAPAGLQQRDYGIKVEKVDLADEDDESLEATFSHVSNFEASQFEGSDHSAGSHDMSGLLGRVSDQGMGDMSAMAGPSEDGIAQVRIVETSGSRLRPRRPRTEDRDPDRDVGQSNSKRRRRHARGAAFRKCWRSPRQLRVSSADHQVAPCWPEVSGAGRRPSLGPAASSANQAVFPCDLCGRVLGSIGSLRNHRSIHRGTTRCQLCGNVYSTISVLRRHVRLAHGGDDGGRGAAGSGTAPEEPPSSAGTTQERPGQDGDGGPPAGPGGTAAL